MLVNWTCQECGFAENDGRFCLKCGQPRMLATDAKNNVKKPEKYASIEEAKQHFQPPYGKLISVKYSGWSSGMMMNSYQNHALELTWKSEEEMILMDSSSAFGTQSSTCYQISGSVPEEIRRYVKQEKIRALEQLELPPPDPAYLPTDFSGGSSLTMVFDDSTEGGHPRKYCTINGDTLSRAGGRDILTHIRKLLEQCQKTGTVIQNMTESESSPLMGFMGMGILRNQQEIPASSTGWRCPSCGHDPCKGKFCPECGSKRPPDTGSGGGNNA